MKLSKASKVIASSVSESSGRQPTASTVSRAPSSSSFSAAVGTLVWKLFDDGWFWGKVVEVKVCTENNPRCCRIVYEDGDCEDVSSKELRKIAKNAQHAKPSPRSASDLAQKVREYYERQDLDEEKQKFGGVDVEDNRKPPALSRSAALNREGSNDREAQVNKVEDGGAVAPPYGRSHDESAGGGGSKRPDNVSFDPVLVDSKPAPIQKSPKLLPSGPPSQRKRPAAPAKPRARKRAKAGCYYDRLNYDTRVRILSYLLPEDLSEACLVSAQFRRDCRHESLPAMERRATIVSPWDYGISTPRQINQFARELRCRLKGMSKKKSFGRSVTCLRVVQERSNSKPTAAPVKRVSKDFVARGITCLDLSDLIEGEDLVIENVVPLLPDLCHFVCPLFFNVESSRPPFVDSLTWRGAHLPYQAIQLGEFYRLKNLYMDDLVLRFYDPADRILALFDPRHVNDEVPWDHILCPSLQGLERVSLRRLRCTYDGATHPIAQLGLIKFVQRHSSTLQWFRSALTPESVALLRMSEITFVS